MHASSSTKALIFFQLEPVLVSVSYAMMSETPFFPEAFCYDLMIFISLFFSLTQRPKILLCTISWGSKCFTSFSTIDWEMKEITGDCVGGMLYSINHCCWQPSDQKSVIWMQLTTMEAGFWLSKEVKENGLVTQYWESSTWAHGRSLIYVCKVDSSIHLRKGISSNYFRSMFIHLDWLPTL